MTPTPATRLMAIVNALEAAKEGLTAAAFECREAGLEVKSLSETLRHVSVLHGGFLEMLTRAVERQYRP